MKRAAPSNQIGRANSQASASRIILFSAVDGMKVGQDVVAIEHSRGCLVTNLELRHSTWNRLESLTNAGFASVGTPNNCGI